MVDVADPVGARPGAHVDRPHSSPPRVRATPWRASWTRTRGADRRHRPSGRPQWFNGSFRHRSAAPSWVDPMAEVDPGSFVDIIDLVSEYGRWGPALAKAACPRRSSVDRRPYGAGRAMTVELAVGCTGPSRRQFDRALRRHRPSPTPVARVPRARCLPPTSTARQSSAVRCVHPRCWGMVGGWQMGGPRVRCARRHRANAISWNVSAHLLILGTVRHLRRRGVSRVRDPMPVRSRDNPVVGVDDVLSSTV